MAKLNLKEQIKITAKPLFNNGLLNNENIKKKIVIIQELKDLIKPLQVEEFEQLKANILQNGCQDTIKIWQTSEQIINPEAESNEEMFVLIDGHNRYKICSIHHITFNIVLMFFADLQAAKNYMLDLQMGRRNLNQIQMAYYRGLRYNNEKITAKTDNFSKDSKDEKTSDKIAKQFKVDEKTIRRDGEFASGLEMLSPNFRKEVLAGKQKVSKKAVQQLVKLEIVSPIESVEDLENVLDKTASIKLISSRENNKISREMFLQIQDKLNKVYETNNLDEFNLLNDLIQNLGKLITA